MQRIATVIGSGREISWDAGRFFLDAQEIPLGKVLEYDGLGALDWASDQTRQWADSLAATQLGAPQDAPAGPVPAPAQPSPAAAPRRTRKPARPAVIIAEALVELALLVWFVLSLPSANARLVAGGIAVLHLLTITIPWIPGVARSTSRAPRIALSVLGGIVTLLTLAILLPLGIQAGIDAARPVPVRAAGEFPAVNEMLGRGQHDARRMLGYPRDFRAGTDPEDTYEFSLPDIGLAEVSTPTSGSITLNDRGTVETVSFGLVARPGEYAGLAELLSARLGYEGRLTGQVSYPQDGLSAVCCLLDATPTCSVYVEQGTLPNSGNLSIQLSFARTFEGDSQADLSAADLAFGAAGRSGESGTAAGTPHRGETMYALIAESVETREDAQRRLADFRQAGAGASLPWTVETSDHFTGMRPGWQVVMVAFAKEGNAKAYSVALRENGYDTYVKTVTKDCDDPIVVEE